MAKVIKVQWFPHTQILLLWAIDTQVHFVMYYFICLKR